ncbi:amino acid permease [Thermoanaerobacter ethanolicus]
MMIGNYQINSTVFSKVHPKFRTPSLAIYFIGIATMLVAGFLPINIIAELVNIGTMLAFILTSIGVIVLRYKQPDLAMLWKKIQHCGIILLTLKLVTLELVTFKLMR